MHIAYNIPPDDRIKYKHRSRKYSTENNPVLMEINIEEAVEILYGKVNISSNPLLDVIPIPKCARNSRHSFADITE